MSNQPACLATVRRQRHLFSFSLSSSIHILARHCYPSSHSLDDDCETNCVRYYHTAVSACLSVFDLGAMEDVSDTAAWEARSGWSSRSSDYETVYSNSGDDEADDGSAGQQDAQDDDAEADDGIPTINNMAELRAFVDRMRIETPPSTRKHAAFASISSAYLVLISKLLASLSSSQTHTSGISHFLIPTHFSTAFDNAMDWRYMKKMTSFQNSSEQSTRYGRPLAEWKPASSRECNASDLASTLKTAPGSTCPRNCKWSYVRNLVCSQVGRSHLACFKLEIETSLIRYVRFVSHCIQLSHQN